MNFSLSMCFQSVSWTREESVNSRQGISELVRFETAQLPEVLLFPPFPVLPLLPSAGRCTDFT